jgi:hypothetical protein
MALMIGIRPTRIASRRLSEIARRQSWPSASRVSMTSRLCAASWVRRSSPSEMPFIVLPRIMPSNGMAYCGAYQGSVPMTTTSASTVTANDDTNIDRVPTPNPHQPTKRRRWRTITSRPATVSITAASSATHAGVGMVEENLEHKADQKQLHRAAQRRNQQLSFATDLHAP